VIGSWSKSIKGYVEALGLKGSTMEKRCAAITIDSSGTADNSPFLL
jgi:hypothetical protein